MSTAMVVEVVAAMAAVEVIAEEAGYAYDKQEAFLFVL